MTIREQRQWEAVNAYVEHVDRRAIINACPRFGKIKVAIEVLRRLGLHNPIIFAPRNDIKAGWDKDFVKFHMEGGFEFRTFASIKKLSFFSHRLVIIDEPHEMSFNQQRDLAKRIPKGIPILGLTGTLTETTRTQLYNNLKIDVCYKYSIAQGVEEGVLADYEIIMHEIELDNSRYIYKTKKKDYTERGYFHLYQYIRDEAEGKNKRFMELKMIKIIQDSIAKLEKTRKLISMYKDERLLVFCGTTAIADKMGIPAYHSKAKEKEVFDSFCEGGIQHLVTIKMMQAGITITPINRGIVNYMSGNSEDSAQKISRFLGLEYDNLDKKAYIHIVCTNEEFEKYRLSTALQFFDPKKIKYVTE